MSKVVLGKGLEALIPSEKKSADESRRLKHLPLDDLAPNPLQPRHDFDETTLQELAQSIKSNGVIQPLIVKANGSEFVIIAGERRFRAAKLAGLKHVPVVLMDDVDDIRMLELALIENVQREDLNPLEVAQAYKMLLDKCGLTQHQLAEKVGKSRTAVTNLIRLLALPDSIKVMIHDGRITEGHARAILAMDTEVEMIRLANKIVSESLSVRVVESTVSLRKRKKLVPAKKNHDIIEVEAQLKQILGTSVKIIPGLKKGRIEIEYYGMDDLNRVIDLLKSVQR